MQPDLTYYHSDCFTVFWPETRAGEEAWNEIARHNEGNAKVWRWQAKDTIKQLRAAGYVVRMKNPRRATADEIDALLAELES